MNVLYPPQIRNRPRRDSGGICWLVTGTGVGGWGRVGSSQPLSRLQAVTPASVSADSGVVVTRGWGLPWSFPPAPQCVAVVGMWGLFPCPPAGCPWLSLGPPALAGLGSTSLRYPDLHSAPCFKTRTTDMSGINNCSAISTGDICPSARLELGTTQRLLKTQAADVWRAFILRLPGGSGPAPPPETSRPAAPEHWKQQLGPQAPNPHTNHRPPQQRAAKLEEKSFFSLAR